MLGDRFQDGNEILIISYKASPYFSQLFNATDGRRASKPSTHNTFSFRPRTSLELQENVFLRFYFRKILMQTNGSCFFISPCQNRFYYLPRLITCCSFSGSCFYDRASFDTELLHRVQKNKVSVKTVRKCNHVAQHYITLSLSYEITAVYFTSMTWVSNKGFPTDLWRFTQCCSQKVN